MDSYEREDQRARHRDFELTFRRLATELRDQIIQESTRVHRAVSGTSSRRAPRFFDYPVPDDGRAPQHGGQQVVSMPSHGSMHQGPPAGRAYDRSTGALEMAPYPRPPVMHKRTAAAAAGQTMSYASAAKRQHQHDQLMNAPAHVQQSMGMQVPQPSSGMPDVSGSLGAGAMGMGISAGGELRLARTLAVPLSGADRAPLGTALELVHHDSLSVVAVALGGGGIIGSVFPMYSRWLAPLLRARAVRCDGMLKSYQPNGQVAEVSVYVDVERVDLSLAEAWRSLVSAMAND